MVCNTMRESTEREGKRKKEKVVIRRIFVLTPSGLLAYIVCQVQQCVYDTLVWVWIL